MNIRVLTQGLDYLQRGLALLEKEGYQTDDFQTPTRHLVADIIERQVNTVSAVEWLTSDSVTKLIDESRLARQRDHESVYASGVEL